jgi:hypothetical protein
MKFACLILISAVLLFSCNRANTEITERIAGADSMAINYFSGDGTMDTVVAVVIIRDTKKIEQLAGLIGAHPGESNHRCGYDGSLHFFKNDQVIQDIDFGFGPTDCMYFAFSQAGKRVFTRLTEEAKGMIKAFRGR